MPEEAELEELEDEAKTKEVIIFLSNLIQSYKDLFGMAPDNNLSIEGIRSKIREEIIRRELRPYKL